MYGVYLKIFRIKLVQNNMFAWLNVLQMCQRGADLDEIWEIWSHTNKTLNIDIYTYIFFTFSWP